MARIPPAARALLDAIASGESSGSYDVIYGGSRFSDFSDHPRQYMPITSGPNEGKKSSAAGKYQFLASTWDNLKSRLGLTDFSPESQDLAAWTLAQDEYKRQTGRDLLADLEAGDTSRVASALKGQWTSLPGGIEQGRTSEQFSQLYGSALGGDNALTGRGLPPSDMPSTPPSLATREPPRWVALMGPPKINFQPVTVR